MTSYRRYYYLWLADDRFGYTGVACHGVWILRMDDSWRLCLNWMNLWR